MPAEVLLLIRHTRVAVPPGVCYGRSDLPLASESAADIAEALAVLPPCTRVLSSPAMRCVALARRVAERDGTALELHEDLQELDFGRWEGKRWDDVPRAELDAWAADPWGHAPGGGESAEQLRARVQRCFESLAGGCAGATDGPVLVVAHQGPLRALLMSALGLPRSTLFELKISFGAAGLRRLERRGASWRELHSGSAPGPGP